MGCKIKCDDCDQRTSCLEAGPPLSRKKGQKRAYKVGHDSCDASVIVFAASPSQAKTSANTTEWLCEYPYIELRCQRLPEADKYLNEASSNLVDLVDGSTVEDQRIMRELGWYEVDGTMEVCNVCDLFEWEDLPESHLEESMGQDVCAGCRGGEPEHVIP